jgi:hypothetical protein
MTHHPEPGSGELGVRSDDTAPVPSADGEQALVAAPGRAAPPAAPPGLPAPRPRRRRILWPAC